MKIQLNRRHFLKLTGAVGAATALGLHNMPAHAQAAGVSRSIDLTLEQQASRFLTQATLGPTPTLINEVALLGPEAWVEAQFNQPIGLLQPVVEQFIEEEEAKEDEGELNATFSWGWWQQAMTSPDVLRQRTAFALSEIFVISQRSDELADSPDGVASYYDLLVRNAFGNFRDLLTEVSMHPTMGFYLSHVRNRKTNIAENRFPDENYAREIMQLFSIGLFELNQDGTQKLDADGNPIPTYSNEEITELAKVFTGLTFAGGNLNHEEFLYGEPNFTDPMVMFEFEHEISDKKLLNGFTIFAGQTGLKDIQDAVEHLFNHENVGPFIGHKLIQRLVKSNPSSEYIFRVAAAFNDNGQGLRGDMRAVVKAILLDPEARDTSFMNDPTHGMLREPFVRYVHLLRALETQSTTGTFKNNGYYTNHVLKQYPMKSPSVFNFFLPAHQPLGPVADAGLVAPEFQITTSVSAITGINFMNAVTFGQYVLEVPEDEEDEMSISLDIAEAESISGDLDALIDYLDLLLTYGTLSDEMRQVIKNAIEPLDEEPMYRVFGALYLFTISPEYAVMK